MSNAQFREPAKAFMRYRRAEQKREDSRFSWCEPKPHEVSEKLQNWRAKENVLLRCGASFLQKKRDLAFRLRNQ